MSAKRFESMLITIPTWEIKKKAVSFQVKVKTATNEWTLARRYDQFEWLYEQIRKEGVQKPPVLPKSKLIGSRDPKFLDNRRILLKNFLQKLVTPDNVAASPTLQRWLEMDELGRQKEPPSRSGINVRAVAVARALYDFASADEKCLSFKKGAVISVTDKSGQDWWKGKFGGRVGVFPKTYVELMAEMEAREDPSSLRPPAPPKPNPALNKRAIGAVRAIADYTGAADELTFKEGDMIAIVAEHDEYWAEGKCHGRAGFFPKNYCEGLGDLVGPDKAAARHVKALFDYQGESATEVSFVEGDVIRVIDDQTDPQWTEGEVVRTGQRGYFPTSYCEAPSQATEPTAGIGAMMKMMGAVAAKPVQYVPPPPPASEPPCSEMYQAEYDYEAESSDQLSLAHGDLIEVTDMSNPDWYFGTAEGRSGYFPSAYVISLDGPPPESKRVSAPSSSVGKVVTAVYARDAEAPDELTLREGDVVMVEKDEGDGWLFGTNKRGQRGAFPENHVE